MKKESTTIISEKSLKIIKDLVSTELCKRGIHVELLNFMETVRNGSHRITFDSTSFQTVPVLMKRLNVATFSSSITFLPREEKQLEDVNVYSVWFQVHANYEHFDGGRNGTELFSFNCHYWESAASSGIDAIIIS